jgi:cold shock CspA family protein
MNTDGPAPQSAPQPVAPERAVQATVATFDPVTGAGTVLTDEGRPLAFGGDAFVAGGLRVLRLGQRVRLEYAGDRIVRVTIHTLR